MEHANTEHNRILAEKETETQNLKQKYSKLEEQFNDLKSEYESAGEQFEKHVNRAANTRVMLLAHEKDQEIQRLQEQINQLLNQQGSRQVKERIEMEEEVPKIRPERIEIEEKKEEVIPRHGMQTRSQSLPSFGEQIQQEIYDPLGNLISKRTGYDS